MTAETHARRKPRNPTVAHPKGGGGGYALNFKGARDTFEDLFGSKPITVNKMTRELWGYVKRHGLGTVGTPYEPLESDVFPEGAAYEQLHVTRERNAALVKLVKGRALAKFGRLTCQACGFDFGRKYGPIGHGFIEAHHTRPLAELTKTTKTRPEDMALVCSNCHRMLHRRRPWLRMSQLRRLMQHNDHRTR